jgi:hypothetical protein
LKGHFRSEEPDPDDEGDQGKDEGKFLSDARLKADVEPIAGALGRLGAIGTELRPDREDPGPLRRLGVKGGFQGRTPVNELRHSASLAAIGLKALAGHRHS